MLKGIYPGGLDWFITVKHCVNTSRPLDLIMGTLIQFHSIHPNFLAASLLLFRSYCPWFIEKLLFISIYFPAIICKLFFGCFLNFRMLFLITSIRFVSSHGIFIKFYEKTQMRVLILYNQLVQFLTQISWIPESLKIEHENNEI